MAILTALATVLGAVGGIIGFIASVLSIRTYLRERQSVQTTPGPVIDPALVKAATEEERVLLNFDSKRKDEPGTLEHLVYSLMTPLDPEYRNYFIETPAGTVRMARMQIANVRVARRFLFTSLAGPALLILMIIVLPLAGLVTEGVLRFAFGATLVLLISGAMLYAIYLGLRANTRLLAKHEQALRAAQCYVDYLNANGILLQLEFTQLKSRLAASSDNKA
jgi:hypothetical protein